MLKKGWKFCLQKAFKEFSRIGLTLSDHKRRKVSHRDDEKDDFQNQFFLLQKMRLLKIPVKAPILQISEDLLFF